MILHATSVAIEGQAILLIGPSGSGKSDLALRLIDRGASLVSDDYTILRLNDGRITAAAPSHIAGRIEVRGLGIAAMQHETDVPVALALQLVDRPERMPEPMPPLMLLGQCVPIARIAAKEASAPIKAEMLLRLRDEFAPPVSDPAE